MCKVVGRRCSIITQGAQPGALWWPRRVGWKRGGRRSTCNYDWFTLSYGRNQHNIVKQVSSNLKTKRNIGKGGNQDGRVGGGWAHLASWTHQKYIYMQREQFSLKTNWRLAERLFYNQGCKQRSAELLRKREATSLGPTYLGGDRGRQGTITGWEILLGSKQSEPHIRHPSPAVQIPGRRILFAGLKTSGLQETETPPLQTICTSLLIP